MRILVLQYDALSPPGLVGDRLLQSGCDLHIVMPRAGGTMPATPDCHDAMLILGGPMGVNDPGHSHFEATYRLVRRFDGARKPVLGICLGGQVIAKAFGARVTRLGFVEFGFTGIRLTAAAAEDPLFAGLKPEPWLMEFHQDGFALPDDACLLATGEACVHQAFRVGHVCHGLQFHVEAGDAVARHWSRLPEARAAYPDGDPVARIADELRRHYAAASEFAERLTDNWLALIRENHSRREQGGGGVAA